ncbi:TMED5 protein, partial [Amia calva]|nr:TMED5 protein [Amia calva]
MKSSIQMHVDGLRQQCGWRRHPVGQRCGAGPGSVVLTGPCRCGVLSSHCHSSAQRPHRRGRCSGAKGLVPPGPPHPLPPSPPERSCSWREGGKEQGEDGDVFLIPAPYPLLLSVSLQVLDGAGLDVDFYLHSPSGAVLARDHRKSDGVHTVETEDGDYMFCFDNSFSALSEKIIFFELILDNMDGEDTSDPEDWKEYVHGTDLLDMKLEDIMDSINSVKARLSKSAQIQTLLRAFEARDRNLQESNYERVNAWSLAGVLVMATVSALQVYLLRSLFDDRRKSRT